jgi:chorismate dehydratase
MWKRDFKWIDTSENFDFINIGPTEAVVLIGDQCFESEHKFKFKTDLAGEWNSHTGLPFVFAVWAANRDIDQGFIDEFNEALKMGVDNIDAVVEYFAPMSVIGKKELDIYLRKNIDYILDDRKFNGMNLFLDLLSKL